MILCHLVASHLKWPHILRYLTSSHFICFQNTWPQPIAHCKSSHLIAFYLLPYDIWWIHIARTVGASDLLMAEMQWKSHLDSTHIITPGQVRFFVFFRSRSLESNSRLLAKVNLLYVHFTFNGMRLIFYNCHFAHSHYLLTYSWQSSFCPEAADQRLGGTNLTMIHQALWSSTLPPSKPC